MRLLRTPICGGVALCALLAGPAFANGPAPFFGDAGLDAVVNQLETRLTRQLATVGPSPQTHRRETWLISSVDEARRLPGPDGDRICRPAHVSAARQGETIASADALACQSPGGTWSLQAETLR